jgi:hypothetical protein
MPQSSWWPIALTVTESLQNRRKFARKELQILHETSASANDAAGFANLTGGAPRYVENRPQP